MRQKCKSMGQSWKWIVYGLILITILFFGLKFSAKEVMAESSYEVSVDVTYNQTSARSMLDMINEFRTGDDAWYYDSSGNVVTVSGLSELTYDYTLEEIAMQRAAEIALSFSHTRPDGTNCFTVYSDYDVVVYAAGENIAAGYSSASEAFTAWCEEDEDYSGQGHRRNMLSSSYTSIGIAHVKCEGTHYWVQVLAKPTSQDATETSANDSATSVSVNILGSSIAASSLKASVDEISVTEGKTASAPGLTEKIRLSDTWPSSYRTVVSSYTWKIADTSIATVNSSGKVTGVSAGETTLKVTKPYGTSVTIPITVSHNYGSWTVTKKATTSANGTKTKTCSACGAVKTSTIKKIKTVSLSTTSYTYNGKSKKPSVTVTDSSGNTLTKGTDYTVSYPCCCKNVGTYKVKVTFKGNYSGSKTLTFKIKPVKTSISKVTAAKKAFTVKWSKKSTQVTGYQIQYSTSSSFSSSKTKTVTVKSCKTTSKKISGLKSKKTYYVRVRTYKTVDGTKYYSSWSSKKKVKTK